MSSGPFDANQPLLLEGLPESKSAHLVSASISETVGVPFVIDLTVRTAESLAAPRVLGQPLTVCVNIKGKPARYFHGLVSELSFQGGEKKHLLYRVVLRPWLWYLDRKSTRLNSSHSQISYAVFCLKKKIK